VNRIIFVFFGVVLLGQAAVAGKEVGNGGSVVACPGTTAGTNYELLDLYEGRTLDGLHFVEQALPARDQARAILSKLDQAQGLTGTEGSMVDALDVFLKRVHFLPPGAGLQPTGDVDTLILPKGCQILQAVNYRNTGEIYADVDIWNSLSQFQLAALLVHEITYSYLRDGRTEETTSVRARRLTARLFAGLNLDQRLPKTPPALRECRTYDAWEAGRPYANFEIFEAPSGHMAIRFIDLNGRAALGLTVIESTHSTKSDWQSGWLDISGLLNSRVDWDTYVWLDARPGRETQLRVRTPTETTNETVTCYSN
jgi:hypothetical protein